MRLLRTRDVARLLNRSEYQVREYHRRGCLPATQYVPGGHLLFHPDDVAEFRRKSRLDRAGARRAWLGGALGVLR